MENTIKISTLEYVHDEKGFSYYNVKTLKGSQTSIAFWLKINYLNIAFLKNYLLEANKISVISLNRIQLSLCIHIYIYDKMSYILIFFIKHTYFFKNNIILCNFFAL